MQYLNKKKTIYGDKTGQSGEDRMSLDKMNLDRKDVGGDSYDPFYKSNVLYLWVSDYRNWTWSCRHSRTS